MIFSGDDYPDDSVRALARLFFEHPAWCRAAAMLSERSESEVRFRHRPGEAWHLAREKDHTRLLPGSSEDPDFAFRFGSRSARRLSCVEGGVGDFAVALFELFDEPDEELRVDFRVVATPARLLSRGYLALLLNAGPKVVAFGASRGVRSWRTLKSLIESSRAGSVDWD